MTLNRFNNSTSQSQEQAIDTRFSKYVTSSYERSKSEAINNEQGSNSGDLWHSKNVSNGGKDTGNSSTFHTLAN